MSRSISNPLIFGPGLWWKLHTDALNLETKEEQLCFIRLLRKTIETLPCNDCRIHALDYIMQNPPEKYLNLVNGLFIYTINFHNNVNRRLGKAILSEESAKALYLTPTICYENCGGSPLVSVAPDIEASVKPYQKKR